MSGMRDDFHVWEGVYDSFTEAPAVGPGFEGLVWRERAVAAAEAALAALAVGEALDYSLRRRNALLPPVVATLLTTRPHVRVLDFGGGLGAGFFVLQQAMPEAKARVDYVIVDSAAICEAGRDLFGVSGPTFREHIPQQERFDIVHAASVLQYIEDWKGAIAMLAAGVPAVMSLADIFAGAFQPYVTLQNYYGSRIRHWFLNLDDVIATVEHHGYRLILRVPCEVEVLGQRGPLPMDNLPAALRIPHTQHLLFARRGGAV